jgi:hypothetical protein
MPLQQPDSASIVSVLSPYRMARHDWKRIQGPLTGLQSYPTLPNSLLQDKVKALIIALRVWLLSLG